MDYVSISLRNKIISCVKSTFLVIDHYTDRVWDFGNTIEKYDPIALIQKFGAIFPINLKQLENAVNRNQLLTVFYMGNP